MANSFMDTSFLDRAIRFAVSAHANSERRGKGFPYIVHPLEAMSIVATITPDAELLAAAALHDTVEDTDVSIEQIRAEFGDRVASIVESESDKPGDVNKNAGETWRERKQAAIDRLARASRDAKIVAIGDKLSNMRAIYNDYMAIGNRLWNRFHAPNGMADHEWHYRGLAESLGELADTPAYKEFTHLIDEVFGAKADLIDMSDYEESGDGFTATSYFHKDGARMIKLYNDFIPVAVPQREFDVSRSLLKMGVSIPEAYRLVTDGTRTGVEFERIVGKRSFARAISQEPERLEAYSRKFASMCRELHSKECDTVMFKPAVDRFRNAAKNSRRFNDQQKSRILSFIDSIPDVTTCIHGDMHIGNAIMAGDKTYWIDTSDFGYGHPYLDLGMYYFIAYGTDDEEMCNKLYHISVAQLRKTWNIFVKEYFGADADIEEIGKMIAPYAALYMVFFDQYDKLLPGMAEYIVKHLIEI